MLIVRSNSALCHISNDHQYIEKDESPTASLNVQRNAANTFYIPKGSHVTSDYGNYQVNVRNTVYMIPNNTMVEGTEILIITVGDNIGEPSRGVPSKGLCYTRASLTKEIVKDIKANYINLLRHEKVNYIPPSVQSQNLLERLKNPFIDKLIKAINFNEHSVFHQNKNHNVPISLNYEIDNSLKKEHPNNFVSNGACYIYDGTRFKHIDREAAGIIEGSMNSWSINKLKPDNIFKDNVVAVLILSNFISLQVYFPNVPEVENICKLLHWDYKTIEIDQTLYFTKLWNGLKKGYMYNVLFANNVFDDDEACIVEDMSDEVYPYILDAIGYMDLSDISFDEELTTENTIHQLVLDGKNSNINISGSGTGSMKMIYKYWFINYANYLVYDDIIKVCEAIDPEYGKFITWFSNSN